MPLRKLREPAVRSVIICETHSFVFFSLEVPKGPPSSYPSVSGAEALQKGWKRDVNGSIVLWSCPECQAELERRQA